MATKTRLELKAEINELCDQSRCTDRVKKIHQSQYVDRAWNPHPPQKFVNWWGHTGVLETEKQTRRAWSDIDAVRAFNCEPVRAVYFEAKQIGLA